MAIESYYRKIELLRPSQTVDAFGDTATTYTRQKAIQGHIGRPSSKVVLLAAQRGINVTGRLYAPTVTGVKPFDVLVDTDGRTFEVYSAPRDAANRGHHVEADLVELRGGVTVAN